MVCNKELIKFRYKPRNEWDIQGMLCGDCHVIKSMEHSGCTESSGSKNRHQMAEDEKEVSVKCGMCDADFDSGSEHLKAKWQWNMDTNLILCKRCYSIKSKEYEKRINYCAICGNKMSFFSTIRSLNGRLMASFVGGAGTILIFTGRTKDNVVKSR